MAVTYQTLVIVEGNHASLQIPDAVLAELGANRRAPLTITVNGHSYRSTATAVSGECRVVFPMRDREASGVGSGDTITVTLELESGHREVELPSELASALGASGLLEAFESLSYSKRRECSRLVSEAKAAETRVRRAQRVVDELSAKNHD